MPSHNDAVYAVRKVPVDLRVPLGEAEMVTLIGDKFGSPKVIAVLYIRLGFQAERG